MPESTRSSEPDNGSVWVTILAGGIGSRFWPVSTPARPKQLLPLGSDRPLIVDTLASARALAPEEHIRIVAGAHMVEAFRGVLDTPESTYWVEPMARGTAPALAWAAWRLFRLDPDAVMISLHADHKLGPLDAFRDTLAVAVDVARHEGLLVSVGAVPTRPETGFGYVQPGAEIPVTGAVSARRALSFLEKPDEETAAAFIKAGHLWNTGIFVWKASVLLDEIRRHAPELAAALPVLDESSEAFFESAPVSVIDRAVMETSDRVAVVEASFAWDDVGSWAALARTHDPDASGNVMVGPARAVDAKGNVTFAEDGEVVLFGVEDLVVVHTAERTLVLPRSRAPDLKTLLTEIEGEAK